MSGDEHQHWCQVCGGPCLTWKGSAHGWTCGGCLDRFIAEQIARHDASHASVRNAAKATEGVRSTKGAEYAMAT